jgi:hypothetical protein
VFQGTGGTVHYVGEFGLDDPRGSSDLHPKPEADRSAKSLSSGSVPPGIRIGKHRQPDRGRVSAHVPPIGQKRHRPDSFPVAISATIITTVRITTARVRYSPERSTSKP